MADLGKINIFNVGEHTEEMNGAMFQEKQEDKTFDPRLESERDTLSFIVRPMPWIKDPRRSLVSKNYYIFNDGLGYVWFDSKTTFNRYPHFEFCPASDLWSKLRNSQDPAVKDKTKQLALKRANYCYVQIVNFPKDSSLNGQIRPMRIPVDMAKAFEAMAKPSDQDIALGSVPTNPFDMFNGKNLKCTITGHVQGGTLMRKWTITPTEATEVLLPLGPNGAMTPVSKLEQSKVLEFFTEQQDIDLEERYGYKEPTMEVKRRVKNVLARIAAGVPGLDRVVAGYFPEVDADAPLNPEAQAMPGMQAPTGINMDAAPTPQPLPNATPAETTQSSEQKGPGGITIP